MGRFAFVIVSWLLVAGGAAAAGTSFSAPYRLTLEWQSNRDARIGDINGDGRQDLVVSSRNDPGSDYTLQIFLQRTDGVLAANALRAADTAVLVVEAGAFALQGASQALAIVEELARDLDRELGVRVLGTLFDRRTRFARELLIAMHARFGEQLFDSVIHTSVRLREAAGRTVGDGTVPVVFDEAIPRRSALWVEPPEGAIMRVEPSLREESGEVRAVVRPGRIVRGTVRDRAGSPVAGATVTLKVEAESREFGISLRTATDGSGAFVFPRVAFGAVRVGVEGESDYTEARRGADVKEDPLVVDLRLSGTPD